MFRCDDDADALEFDTEIDRARLAPWSATLAAALAERERVAAASDRLGLLAWGRRYLPEHFARPPSAMHRWLENELSAIPERRGTKINLLGPRGGAKSTIGTLACPLRAALEGVEPYIWIVSDTRHQAQLH